MNFENLQRELFERKLKIVEYFKKVLEVLKYVIKENKLWILFFVLSYIWLMLSNIKVREIFLKMQRLSLEIRNTGSYEQMELLTGYFTSMLLIVFSTFLIILYVGFVKRIIYFKVACKIEGNEDSYSLKKIFVKYIKMIGVALLATIVFFLIALFVSMIQTFIILIMKVDSALAVKVIQIISMIIFGIIGFFIAINILYFEQTYYIRDMTVIDAFRYNLKLSKKNRLRIVIPVFGITVLNFIISLVLDKLLFYIPAYIIPVNIIYGVFASVVVLIITIMNVVIFLNVEYNYLKNKDEKMRKIEENI